MYCGDNCPSARTRSVNVRQERSTAARVSAIVPAATSNSARPARCRGIPRNSTVTVPDLIIDVLPLTTHYTTYAFKSSYRFLNVDWQLFHRRVTSNNLHWLPR